MTHPRDEQSGPMGPALPLVPLAAAWLAGLLPAVVLPAVDPRDTPAVAGLVLLCVAATALTWPRVRPRWLALMVLAFSLGLLRSVLAVAPVVPPVGSLRALNVPPAEARSHGLPQV
ncbi:MAG TPA: hypothetical protein VM536_08705, partial [Chloroflexia bacterium]|nr:hypothetical protein [Chloroflexia bacterium]